MKGPLVLVIEDDADIADILCAFLEKDGVRAARAGNGVIGLQAHALLRPDLVLLDVQLPLKDGWQVLTEIRQRGDTPVIMLTAMDQEVDKVMALRVGADDYVVKPFSPIEVVARVRAVLRRTTSTPAAAHLLRAGPLEIDTDQHIARVLTDETSTMLPLTLTEFKLLAALAQAPQRVFSRQQLLASCLPEGEPLERTVDSHVSKLRRKLEDAGLRDVPSSVRGVGYRLLPVSG